MWTCQRQNGGQRCGHVNENRHQVCRSCAKRKPARRRPAHLKALELPYEDWVERFGEECGICGARPTTRRLDRDHDHRTGEPRGLLCHRCNRGLPAHITLEWLERAHAYLRRAA